MTLLVVAAVLSLAAVHVVPGSAQSTVIGQFNAKSLTWDDVTPNPCLGSGATDEVGPRVADRVHKANDLRNL